ncbi:TIGR02234 family membrane protein [Tsukamurella soli]|uniref:TIGR02234 family membrane protein n=1 Tax=Tsukamurella soli TaxID=644556 RepID=UPI003613E44B
MTARRSLGITSALLVVAAVLLWVSSRMTWVAVTVADGLSPERHLSASGQQWAGALTPLALVILAGIAAAVALKNRMRRVVAVLIAVVAVAATVPALGVLTSDPDVGHAEQALDLPHKDVVVLIDAHHVAPVVALLGSLAAVAAAVVLIRGSRSTGAGPAWTGATSRPARGAPNSSARCSPTRRAATRGPPVQSPVLRRRRRVTPALGTTTVTAPACPNATCGTRWTRAQTPPRSTVRHRRDPAM